MKIGEAISSIEFSAAEKNRLAGQLRDQTSLAYRVLRGKALEIHDPDFWRWAQKDFQVHGFRHGHRAAREMVLRKALDSLKSQEGSDARKMWPLYRRCVTEYVVEDLEQLNTLLAEEDLLDRDTSLTDRVFRSIRKVLPLYRVRNEQVRELYALWGFERTPNFDVILSDDALDASVAQRLVANEGRTIAAQALARVGDLRADLQSSIRQEAVSATSHLQRDVDALKLGLSTSMNSIGERVTGLAEALRDIEQKLSESKRAPQVDKGGDEQRHRNPLDEKILQSLKSKVDSLVGNVNRHEKVLSELIQGKRLETAHRPIDQLNAEPWEATLTRGLASCREGGFELRHLGAIRILIELVRRSRVILCSRDSLPLRLISTCEPTEVRKIAASPLWIDASDWRASLDFVSDFDAPTRVLVLLDFDIALQESYLVPALRTWIATVPRPCQNRVIIVPALPSLENVSPRVLELCNAFRDSADDLSEFDRLARTIDSALTGSWSTSKVSRPLAFCEHYQREHEAQIQQVVSNIGTELPSPLAERFVSLVAGLQEVLSAGESVRLASASVLLPWIRQARSDGAARLLNDTLRSLYGL